MSSHAFRSRPLTGLPLGARSVSLPVLGPDGALSIALTAVLAAIAFAAQGGLQLERNTWVELPLIIGSGAVVAVGAMAGPRTRLHGAGALLGFLALGLVTVASVAWAADPSTAWQEADRTLTYVAVFAAAVALVRLAPARWPAVLGGIALAGVVVSVYALLSKVFPGALSPDEVFARLRTPYGYWNAVGLEAALAVPPLLWLGARRHGPPLLNALAVPALGLVLVALLLAYSRGALLALVIGGICWFAVVPLRLRGLAVLAGGVAGAAPVVAWAFSQDALSQDHIALGYRLAAGHRLGLLLLALVLALTAAGLLGGFAAAARPLSRLHRRRVGIVVLCLLALLPIGVGVALSQSHRGFTGSISHDFSTLTNPNAPVPNNGPGRLTSVGSVRARYWRDGLAIGRDHPLAGTGAGGYGIVRPHYRQDTLDVLNAHGYVVETFSDLGAIGLAASLAALLGWGWATARSTGLRRSDRGRRYTPERIGLLTLASVVVVFGVHSLVDWTWFVPGTALIAMIAAGWVAGRGPLAEQGAAPVRALPPRAWAADRGRLVFAVGVMAAALVLAWAAWQPLRSANANGDALAALARHQPRAAQQDALAARSRDPLSIDPLVTLSLVDERLGNRAAALRALQDAVRLQPANERSWLALADFQLNRLHRPRAALRSLAAALYLDPRNSSIVSDYLNVRRSIPAAARHPRRHARRVSAARRRRG